MAVSGRLAMQTCFVCHITFLIAGVSLLTTPADVYSNPQPETRLFHFSLAAYHSMLPAVTLTIYGTCFFHGLPNPRVRRAVAFSLFSFSVVHVVMLICILPANYFVFVVTFSLLTVYKTRAVIHRCFPQQAPPPPSSSI